MHKDEEQNYNKDLHFNNTGSVPQLLQDSIHSEFPQQEDSSQIN